MDFVTITNAGDEPYVGRFRRKEYVIEPGESRTMPYAALLHWMGDPAARDIGPAKDRTEAFRKLCVRYHARDLDGNHPDLLPKLEAYDPDGRRIITVLDDPEGTQLTVDTEDSTDIGVLQRQMERLQKQMDTALAGLTDKPKRRPRKTPAQKAIEAQEQAAREQAEEQDGSEGGGIPVDSPTQVPVGRS